LYNEFAASERDLRNPGEMVLELGNFNGHVRKHVDGFENVHGGNGIGKRNAVEECCLKFCGEIELCVANT